MSTPFCFRRDLSRFAAAPSSFVAEAKKKRRLLSRATL